VALGHPVQAASQDLAGWQSNGVVSKVVNYQDITVAIAQHILLNQVFSPLKGTFSESQFFS
jgi:hypothetical protein